MYVPQRQIIAFLCFFAIFFIYFVRVNLSVTILQLKEEYSWSATVQGNVLSSFFWGYLILQIPSGILATKYGGGPVLFVGMLIPAVFSLLCVPVAKYPVVLVIFQVIIGLGAALTFPAIYAIFAKWIPTEERSFSIGFVWTGLSLGNALGTLLAGYIADHHGWRAVFYIFAGLNLLWCVVWIFLGASSPENYKYISEQEKEFIRTHLPQSNQNQRSRSQSLDAKEINPVVPAHQNSTGDQIKNEENLAKSDKSNIDDVLPAGTDINSANKNPSDTEEIKISVDEVIHPGERDSSISMDTVAVIPIQNESILDQLKKFPWKAGLTSPIAYAPYLAHFSSNWIVYTLNTLLPKYMTFKLNTSVQKSGEFSFYPYLCHGIISFSAGYFCGYLIRKGYNPTIVRRATHAIGAFGALLFIIICINIESKNLFLTFMCLGLASVASLSTAFTPNFLDISPKYGSFLISLSNTLATVPGIVSPIIATAILGEDETNGEWMTIFYLACGILFVCSIYFAIFAKGVPIESLNW